jgi:hypothetical protein
MFRPVSPPPSSVLRPWPLSRQKRTKIAKKGINDSDFGDGRKFPFGGKVQEASDTFAAIKPGFLILSSAKNSLKLLGLWKSALDE